MGIYHSEKRSERKKGKKHMIIEPVVVQCDEDGHETRQCENIYQEQACLLDAHILFSFTGRDAGG
jgi:hypothetical protein